VPNASRLLDWSAQSRRDLLRLDSYYAQFGQITADRVMAAIRRAPLSIERFPLSGRAWEKRQGVRLKPLKTYPLTIVYRLRRANIQVIRVIEQHREYFN
jgi:plasmid stabilization system protein ParE